MLSNSTAVHLAAGAVAQHSLKQRVEQSCAAQHAVNHGATDFLICSDTKFDLPRFRLALSLVTKSAQCHIHTLDLLLYSLVLIILLLFS